MGMVSFTGYVINGQYPVTIIALIQVRNRFFCLYWPSGHDTGIQAVALQKTNEVAGFKQALFRRPAREFVPVAAFITSVKLSAVIINPLSLFFFVAVGNEFGNLKDPETNLI